MKGGVLTTCIYAHALGASMYVCKPWLELALEMPAYIRRM